MVETVNRLFDEGLALEGEYNQYKSLENSLDSDMFKHFLENGKNLPTTNSLTVVTM